MIVGGIWLIYKQKIYIDRETKQVTEIDIPLFGKLKTNVPALVLFALGFVPLLYPISRSQTQYVKVHGSVVSSVRPVTVYAVVETQVVENGETFSLPIPLLQSADYTPKVLYVLGASQDVFGDLLDTQQQRKGVIDLREKQISPSSQPAQQSVAFEPDIAPPPAEFSH